MFQLASPNIFRSFICANGELKPLKAPATIPGIDLSHPKDQFHITVEAKDSLIKHSIRIASAPKKGIEPELFSVLSLNEKDIWGGTIGFGTKDGEETILYSLEVRPIE